jgi:hypothetical protein
MLYGYEKEIVVVVCAVVDGFDDNAGVGAKRCAEW